MERRFVLVVAYAAAYGLSVWDAARRLICPSSSKGAPE